MSFSPQAVFWALIRPELRLELPLLLAALSCTSVVLLACQCPHLLRGVSAWVIPARLNTYYNLKSYICQLNQLQIV